MDPSGKGFHIPYRNHFGICSYSYKKEVFFSTPGFKELIKFGSPLQVNDILTFFFQRIDSVVVAAFLGPADLALYEVARKIPDNLRGLYNPFISVYFPFISKRYDLDSREHASDLLNDAVRFVAFVTLLGTAIAILFGQAIIQFLFSGKYVSQRADICVAYVQPEHLTD